MTATAPMSVSVDLRAWSTAIRSATTNEEADSLVRDLVSNTATGVLKSTPQGVGDSKSDYATPAGFFTERT